MNMTIRFISASVVFLLAVLPAPARCSDTDLQSDTYLHLTQADQAVGPNTDHASLYEYISLDLWETGRPELSLHFYGWGRLELGDESGSDNPDGHLSSAYLAYRPNSDRGSMRLGRIFLTEGTSMEALDGIHFRHSFGMAGISVFGGAPNESDPSLSNRGDTLTGARTFFQVPGRMEIGLSYLHEDGDFGGDTRDEAGTDLWFRPTGSVEITGRAVYNVSTTGLASDDLSLKLAVTRDLDVVLTSTGYSYEDLFQAVTNPAFLSSNISTSDAVRIMKGEIHWSSSGTYSLHGAVKSIDHKENDPGLTQRAEVGLDLDPSSLVDKVGLRAARQDGDIPENSYSELRAFCMFSPGRWRMSLDALSMMYRKKISGEDQTLQVVGSAGWKVSEALDLSGDVRLTKSPVFEEDVALMLKARYNFGVRSGVN